MRLRAPEQFANNARTFLARRLGARDQTLTVESTAGFPGRPQFRVLVDRELMLVVEGASTQSWTIVRGIEGTTVTDHDEHAAVTHIVTAGALETLRNPWFDVRAFGAAGDGKTDDTEAIQAAIDAAGAAHGIAYVPASSAPYVFSSLRLSPYMKLAGAHMRQTQLQRRAGASGPALRERTPSEGNPYGATGIWIENLTIDGNGTSGNGVDLGHQSKFQLSTAAGLANVHVTRFPDGTAIDLNANAVSFSYLSASESRVGLRVAGGGANVFHSVWSEYNSEVQLEVADMGDRFFGCQFEDTQSGKRPVLRVDGSQNAFYGIYIAARSDKDAVIYNARGANRNTYYDVFIDMDGHTFGHAILHAGMTVGTGSSDYTIHSFVIGESTGAASWYVNGTTGRATRMAGDVAAFGGGIATRLVDGPPTDTNIPGAVDGTIAVDAKHGRIYVRIHGAWKSVALS